jgi:DNA-binding CsgD family transcriptional regulator
LLVDGDWLDAQSMEDTIRADSAIPWHYVVDDVGWLARHQGLPALAWAVVRAELPDGPETEPGGRMFRPTAALIRLAADLALDAGDLPTAKTWLAAHDRWLAWSGAVLGQAEGHLAWARYHLIAGDLGTARQCAERGLRQATEPRQPLALLRAHRLASEVETAAGRTAEAAAHLDEALALVGACAAPYERALTFLALAELRATTGKTSEARAALDEVRAICVPLNAALPLAQVDALLSRLTAALSAGDLPAGLSVRELEVLRLVADGLTDAEVAHRLSISPRTVGQHLRSVYNKIGVPSRAAATRYAVEHGLV